MLTIIHGDNVKESREYYFQLKQKSVNVKTLYGDKVTMTDLVEAIEGKGLFFESDDVFIEALLTKKQAGKEVEPLILYLSLDRETKIFLWEQRLIDKRVLKKFPKVGIKEFSYPQTLFQFLDAIRPKNERTILALYHQALQTLEPEIIFFMLVKQTRILLALKEKAPMNISEVQIMQSWQKSKLEKQSSFFATDSLKHLHEQLFELDWRSKSGRAIFPLADSLDFFLAQL